MDRGSSAGRLISWPLTLLSAPAGFGKTNLLVEWVAQNARSQSSRSQSALSIAWLTLDREDNDLVRFFRYLISALQARWQENGILSDS